MKITIILVVYNRVDVLRKALISVLCQSVLPHEIIISDDGSQQDVRTDIADLVKKNDCPVKYVRQEDVGFRLARCRNNAIREATGDYLVFWDQDIIATKNYLKVFAEHGRDGRFLTSLPIRLDENQTGLLSEENIADYSFLSFIHPEQYTYIRTQFRKDTFYYYQRKFLLGHDTRPKVRGGAFGVAIEDLKRVDGFDENYQGWGNEDDDLGKRLYQIGVVGMTSFKTEFPIHMYHHPHRVGMQNVNNDYYNKRKREIKNGTYKAVRGLSNPLGDDKVEIVTLS